MVLTRKQKEDVIAQYQDSLSQASSVCLFVEKGCTGEDIVLLRKKIRAAGILMKVVRKRIFLMAASQVGFSQTTGLETVLGNIYVLYGTPDNEYSYLKHIIDFTKELKKSGSEAHVSFLGGWFNKQRQDAAYVTELATIPSREVLLGKFLFMVQYPLKGLAMVLDQYAKQKEQA
ncbi:MAG: 50S ribosomal protein L10 [Candidatus Absconditabacterales bacterium]|nr:50S ribosomal protein L10 [Candidatus Absconditabacterales bacterium]